MPGRPLPAAIIQNAILRLSRSAPAHFLAENDPPAPAHGSIVREDEISFSYVKMSSRSCYATIGWQTAPSYFAYLLNGPAAAIK